MVTNMPMKETNIEVATYSCFLTAWNNGCAVYKIALATPKTASIFSMSTAESQLLPKIMFTTNAGKK